MQQALFSLGVHLCRNQSLGMEEFLSNKSEVFMQNELANGSRGGGFTAVRPAAVSWWSKSKSCTGCSRRRILLSGAEQTGHESWRRRGAAAGVCPGKNGRNWRKCAALSAWSTAEGVSWGARLVCSNCCFGIKKTLTGPSWGKCWWKNELWRKGEIFEKNYDCLLWC